MDAARQDIERIDDAASSLLIPVAFQRDYYSLRSAIKLVRQGIAATSRLQASNDVYDARASL